MCTGLFVCSNDKGEGVRPMLQGGVSIVCKCGQVHTTSETIIFRRDPVANRVKTYCRRCSRRIYLAKVTSDTAAHRKQFRHGPNRTDSL